MCGAQGWGKTVCAVYFAQKGGSARRENHIRSPKMFNNISILAPIALSLTLLAPAAAQDRQGRDTAGDWRVTHYETYGIWNSICDEREEDGALVQRCYLRWVDVYASAPQFGATFLFVTPRRDGGHDVAFTVEPGKTFKNNGFRVDRGDETLWSMTRPACLLWGDCALQSEEAPAALEAMTQGDAVYLDFFDRHERAFTLEWSLEGFAEALGDYETASRARSLI